MDNSNPGTAAKQVRIRVFRSRPGIYLPEFGLRGQVKRPVRNGAAEVTGRIQNAVVLI
jgi:hypothetical protein